MKKMIFICMLFAGIVSCSSGSVMKNTESIEKKNDQMTANDNQLDTSPKVPSEFNFRFIGFDVNIDDPAWDRRSYYKVFIDKIDAGRTSIGLESQKKTFESNISSNRHLLVIEKWALDEKKGQYVKLNNIEQPKPDFFYFDLPDDKTIVIILKNDPFTNKSEYEAEFE